MAKGRFRYKPYRERRSLDSTMAGPILRIVLAVVLLAALICAAVFFVIPALRGRSAAPAASAQTAAAQAVTLPGAVTGAVSRFTLLSTDCLKIADPSIYDGQLLFTAGREAPVYDHLYRRDLSSGAMEEVPVTLENDTIRWPVESARYLAYLDAKADGGGTIRLLDKQTERCTAFKNVAYGHPRILLAEPYLVLTERTGDQEATLLVCDITTNMYSAVAQFSGSAYAASAPSLFGTRLIYADADSGNPEGSKVTAVDIESGEATSFPLATFSHDPKTNGACWAYLTGNHDTDSDLYVSVAGAAPMRVARRAVDFALTDTCVAFGRDEVVYLYLISEDRTFVLSETGVRAQFLTAGGGYVVWTEVTEDPWDTILYKKVEG